MAGAREEGHATAAPVIEEVRPPAGTANVEGLMADNVQFVSHCDDCDLGYVEYECPVCKQWGDDYGDLWWDHHKVYDGEKLKFSCERCKAPLVLQQSEDEWPEVVPGESST